MCEQERIRTCSLVFSTLVLLLSFAVPFAAAVTVNQGVRFNTTATNCTYYMNSTYEFTNVTVYSTALYINSGNITTYPQSGWINMSMDAMSNEYINFTNDVIAANITITHGFANFSVNPARIYQLRYRNNDTLVQTSLWSVNFTNVSAGQWYISDSGVLRSLIALANAINANDTVGVHASYSGASVLITADACDATGNHITTTENVDNASFCAGTLRGGMDVSPWLSVPSGLSLWSSNSQLLALLVSVLILVTILGLVIGLSGLKDRDRASYESHSNTLPVVVSIAATVIILMAFFSLTNFVGYQLEESATTVIEGCNNASGQITFTGEAADGETVTIGGTDVYEFSTDGTVAPGHILVDIS
jgi:hypothetical protein